MDDATLAAALVAWGLLPGWAVLAAAGVGWSGVERAAASAGLSLAVVAAAAYLASALGLPVSPVPVMAIVAVFGGALAIAGRSRPKRAPGDAADDPDGRPAWAAWLIFLLPFVVAAQLEPVSAVALLPPSLHDGLDHANWFRLIYELRSVDPYVVMAPPLAPDGGPLFYPWGLHAWMALVARSTTAEPTTVLMQCLVALSAAVPLSVYVLAAPLIGRGWPAMTAAAFSLFFWWLPYQVWGWGGYPLLAGAVAAPAVARLAIDAFDARHVVPLAAAAICGLGLAALHPSQALVALVIAATVGVAFAASGNVGRRTAVALAAALAAACAALFLAGDWWTPARGFVERAESVGASLSADPRYAWPLGIYRETDLGFPAGRQAIVGLLVAAGAVMAMLRPRARAVVALHAVFVLLIVIAPYGTAITSLWYHAPERIWYAQFVVYPVLASLGVFAAVAIVERLARRAMASGRARVLLWPLAVWIVFQAAHGSWATWMSNRLFLYAQRNENLTLTDARVRADFAWMEANVPAGETVFNAPADWGVPLAFTGRRTVFWSGGVAREPGVDWAALLAALRAGGPAAAAAASDLYLLGIRHVYAGVFDPRFERGGRLPIDGAALEGVPGLERVYASPTARVFRVTGDDAEPLGLGDSDRVHFGGFHPIEETAGTRWRWTSGDSRVYVQPAALTGQSCHLRVFGPDPSTFDVAIDGRLVALSDRGYALPAIVPPATEIEAAIVSPVVIPADTGEGNDSRRLGVRVRGVGLACR